MKDFEGTILKVEDIVYRVIQSTLTIHTVLKINKESIVLSVFKVAYTYPSGRTVKFVQRTTEDLESLKFHNSSMRIPSRYLTLLKYKNIDELQSVGKNQSIFFM